MGRELSGEPRLYGCQTNFLIAFSAGMETQASMGQLLPGSSSIESLVGVREHRTQHDFNVLLAYPMGML